MQRLRRSRRPTSVLREGVVELTDAAYLNALTKVMSVKTSIAISQRRIRAGAAARVIAIADPTASADYARLWLLC